MRRLYLFPCLCLLLLLAACSSDGRASAPELVAPKAISARAFDPGQCRLTTTAAVPAYLNPDAEPGSVGDETPGDAEVIQVVTMRDGSLWYQLAVGVWIQVDGIEYSTRGDCAP